MKSNFRVLGAGVWGLAFSDYLLELGHNVDVFSRDTSLSNKNLNGIPLSNFSNIKIKPLDTLQDYKASDAINIIAVNSQGFDELLSDYINYFDGINELASLTKGIDHKSGLLLHERVEDILGKDIKYGLISGPSFAKDLSDRKKMVVSIASFDDHLANKFVQTTKSSFFEMIPTSHLYHIEIAGIIKNIAAILCGMADSYFDKGSYTNKIIKKACDETWRMSYDKVDSLTELGSIDQNYLKQLDNEKEKIITSPGYIGDMILTCKQKQSRNYQFGNLISQSDVSIDKVNSEIGTVEGYNCCISLVENSYLQQGELTNLLYNLIKSSSGEREKMLKSFLQA